MKNLPGVLSALFLFLGQLTPAHATNFTVDWGFDSADANLGDGLGLDWMGQRSLRAAIQEANYQTSIGNTGPHHIYLTLEDYILCDDPMMPGAQYGPGEDDGVTGDLDIYCDLVIHGIATRSNLSGSSMLEDRVIHIHTGSLEINDVNIYGVRQYSYDGGGVKLLPGCQLTMTDCSINDCWVEYSGGGIYNDHGTVSLTNTDVIDNYSGPGSRYPELGGGGGLYNFGGTVTIDNCSFSGNFASYPGGSIFSSNGSSSAASLTITDSTISSSVTETEGGGICVTLDHRYSTYPNDSTLTADNLYCYLNEAMNKGGGAIANGSSALDSMSTPVHFGGIVTITDSTLTSNVKTYWYPVVPYGGGGAYYQNGGDTTFYGTSITDNLSDEHGGGVYNNAGHIDFLNNTWVTDNEANSSLGYVGGGLYNLGSYYIDGTSGIINNLPDNIAP